MDKIRQAPFLRLLLPLLAGIIIQYYYPIYQWSIIPSLAGLGIMLLSYFIPTKFQYNSRWFFGAGVFLLLFATGIQVTSIRQHISNFAFPDINELYDGVITDIPQDKPNTIAYNVHLTDYNKKIICYIPKDTSLQTFGVGDNISFFSKIQPFRYYADKDDFNYSQYMYNKGYAGFSLIRTERVEKTGTTYSDITIIAAKCRQHILRFYQSLQLTSDEYALLSALTLGYKDALSDDMAESFRNTGVAHILAVSGMHIGIIYFIIIFLLGFIPRHSRYFWLRQILTILFLWLYTFMIGLPPSAIRATIMISMFCLAEIGRRKTNPLNILFATAFLMLVWNPLQLFDLGFQLSFSAVFSMLTLLPVFSRQIRTNNKYLRYICNILLVSVAAQIGTFPLCLYYFGTFPTYFFLANLLIIPLVCLIVYTALGIIITSLIGAIFPLISYYLTYILILIYQALVKCITAITYFIESLPFSQIQNIKIPLLSLFFIWIIISSTIYFLLKKNPKALICSLICIFLLCSQAIISKRENYNSLKVYYQPNKEFKLSYQIGYQNFTINDVTENKLLSLNNIKYLIVTNDVWKSKSSPNKFDIDYLHLTGENSVSLYSLKQKFNIKKVILDSSLSSKTAKRFVSECEKLRITYYDISEKGSLRIFF